MIVLVPLGSDQTVRRWPWFTIFVIAICLVVQIHEQMVAPADDDLDTAGEQLLDATHAVAARAGQIPDTDRAQWMRDCQTGALTGDDATVCLDFKNAVVQMQRLAGKTFAAHWAYHPGKSSPLNLLLYAFVHAGWVHLIGNMLFLWLIGCNLEDRWRHVPFALLYLSGAVVAAVVYGSQHPSTPMGIVGASGAIAAGMGAFAVTHGGASIRMGYFIASTRIRSGTFWIRALYALPIWFVLQLWLASRESSVTPVAYSAHVGGFLFGAAVAAALRYSGLEAKYLLPHANKDLEWEEDPEFLEAHQLIAAQRHRDAQPLIQRVLARKPDHAGAREATVRIAAALGDRTTLQATLATEIDRLARARRHTDIHELFVTTETSLPDFPLPDRALAQVIHAACEQRDIDAVEHAMRRLVTLHRESPLIPKALYETAQAQAAAGFKDSAQQTLRDLVARYPMDPVAELAKRQLS
jgi:membrane associated rhomboid family serine protease